MIIKGTDFYLDLKTTDQETLKILVVSFYEMWQRFRDAGKDKQAHEIVNLASNIDKCIDTWL